MSFALVELIIKELLVSKTSYVAEFTLFIPTRVILLWNTGIGVAQELLLMGGAKDDCGTQHLKNKGLVRQSMLMSHLLRFQTSDSWVCIFCPNLFKQIYLPTMKNKVFTSTNTLPSPVPFWRNRDLPLSPLRTRTLEGSLLFNDAVCDTWMLLLLVSQSHFHITGIHLRT